MKTLWRQVRADFARMMHPLAIFIFAVFLILIFTDFNKSQNFAELQTPVAIESFSRFATTQGKSCFDNAISSPITCEDKNFNEVARLNYNFLVNSVTTGETAQQSRGIYGLARFVAHHLSTGWGWLLSLSIASILTGLEITQRAMGHSLLANHSWRRWFLIRWLAITSACISSSILILVLLIFNSLINSSGTSILFNLSNKPEYIQEIVRNSRQSVHWNSLGALATHSIVAILCVATWSALSLSLIIMFRRPLGGVLLNVALLMSIIYGGQRLIFLFPTAGISHALSLNKTFGFRDFRSWTANGRPHFAGEIIQYPHGWVVGLVIWIGVALALAFLSIQSNKSRGIR